MLLPTRFIGELAALLRMTTDSNGTPELTLEVTIVSLCGVDIADVGLLRIREAEDGGCNPTIMAVECF